MIHGGKESNYEHDWEHIYKAKHGVVYAYSAVKMIKKKKNQSLAYDSRGGK